MASSPAASSSIPPPPLGPAPVDANAAAHGGPGGPPPPAAGPHANGGALTSTPYLQSSLGRLRQQSQNLSSALTRKLATSRSGQSLLHIGPSLSTLPPDLASLADALAPLLDEVRAYEAGTRRELRGVAERGREVRRAARRRRAAAACAEIYRDLAGAEEVLRRDVGRRLAADGIGGGREGAREEKVDKGGDGTGGEAGELDWSDDDDEEEEDGDAELDHATSLERAAYTALRLLRELDAGAAAVSALTAPGGGDGAVPAPADGADAADGPDGVAVEKSRFLLRLAPRIRRLESDTAKCLVGRLEGLLVQVRQLAEEEERDDDDDDHDDGEAGNDDGGRGRDVAAAARRSRQAVLLLTVAACLRALALLSRGSDAESAFARVAIMPLLRAQLSMGRLDAGGPRGACAGLPSLLDAVAAAARRTYGPLLRESEGAFAPGPAVPGRAAARAAVDLVTGGVWAPVATALTADPGVKTAVFSPGIAAVLQANYRALDAFLSALAGNLLRAAPAPPAAEEEEEKRERGDFAHLYYRPDIDAAAIARARARLYAHPTTVDYYKRWNLPIYYQLRFAEFCKRLDAALAGVRREGWQARVFTGEAAQEARVRETPGFELPLFVEVYATLLSLWSPSVFLRPLTHRFLRGATQLVGRVLAFVREGLEGQIEFGGSSAEQRSEGTEGGAAAAASSETIVDVPAYRWNERVEDIAVVSWELTILDTCMSHDYLEAVAATVCPPEEEGPQGARGAPSSAPDETRLLAGEVLAEASRGLAPLVANAWNERIVDRLTARCCAPLAAVKGVAATYRMTNRPPPAQASPFVATVLRPLAAFDAAYASRTPPQIGDAWKRRVVSATADTYSLAVEELIATVKRTEEALKSRKTRRMMAGGMSDGEKVKLQLYLDHMEFKSHVEALGVDGGEIEGLVKLGELTKEAESLFQRTQEKK